MRHIKTWEVIGMSENKINVQELQFQLYQSFFELEETFIARKVTDHAMNLRIPKKMNKLIDEEIEDLKKRVGIKLSKNDFIVMMLMTALNYAQHKENPKHIYKKSNKSSLSHYIDQNQPEMIERIKELMFQKQLEILYKPNMRTQRRLQENEKLKNRYELDLDI